MSIKNKCFSLPQRREKKGASVGCPTLGALAYAVATDKQKPHWQRGKNSAMHKAYVLTVKQKYLIHLFVLLSSPLHNKQQQTNDKNQPTKQID